MNAPVDRIVPASRFHGDVVEALERDAAMESLRRRLRHPRDWQDRLNIIRDLYRRWELFGGRLEDADPYVMGIEQCMTPIERLLWQDLRPNPGGLNFLMQVPIGPYVLDFADPERRVAVEADGIKFHDPDRDQKRDQILWDRYGWKVYRVTGGEIYCRRPSPAEWESEYHHLHGEHPEFRELWVVVRDFFSSTSRGVVHAISAFEGRLDPNHAWSVPMIDTLNSHRLASFPVGAP